jgi:uncharacterized protein YneF (UPF0154 family)
MASEINTLVLAFVVGIGGAALTAFVSMKIMMAKFETWRDIRDGNIRDLMKDMVLVKEDVYVHDAEISTVYEVLKIQRLIRQGMRR